MSHIYPSELELTQDQTPQRSNGKWTLQTDSSRECDPQKVQRKACCCRLKNFGDMERSMTSMAA